MIAWWCHHQRRISRIIKHMGVSTMNDTMNAKDVCSTNLIDVDNSAQGLTIVQFNSIPIAALRVQSQQLLAQCMPDKKEDRSASVARSSQNTQPATRSAVCLVLEDQHAGEVGAPYVQAAQVVTTHCKKLPRIWNDTNHSGISRDVKVRQL